MDIGTTAWGASAVAFFHTVLGPDHYIPLLAIGAAGRWRWYRVLLLTLACGLAHVLSSVLLGLAGAGLGSALSGLEMIQEHAGAFAGWGLVVVGAAYAAWGLTPAGRHAHDHAHSPDDGAARGAAGIMRAIAPWSLFLIFAFGPCEPLIAFTFAMGVNQNYLGVAWISSVFSLVTLATMSLVVLGAYGGLMRLETSRLAPFSHFLAGLVIALSGLSITLLGL